MRNWKFWLGLIISLFFLTIALYGLNLHEFLHHLANAQYGWLIPAVCVYGVATWIRSWRWQLMLQPIRPVSIQRLFPLVTIGYMGNNIYPARAGELLRSYVLRRKEGIAMSASLATVILERLFDGLALLLFIGIALPSAPLPPELTGLALFLSMAFGVVLLVILAIVAQPKTLSSFSGWMINRFVPERWRSPAQCMLNNVITGLMALRKPSTIALIFGLSCLIWLVETCTYWFVMHAFALNIPFPVLMLMAAVVNLFTTIPSTPGHIGVFDAPGIFILTRAGLGQQLPVVM